MASPIKRINLSFGKALKQCRKMGFIPPDFNKKRLSRIYSKTVEKTYKIIRQKTVRIIRNAKLKRLNFSI